MWSQVDVVTALVVSWYVVLVTSFINYILHLLFYFFVSFEIFFYCGLRCKIYLYQITIITVCYTVTVSVVISHNTYDMSLHHKHYT